MAFTQLLAVGRSVVEMGDGPSRYRYSRQTLLHRLADEPAGTEPSAGGGAVRSGSERSAVNPMVFVPGAEGLRQAELFQSGLKEVPSARYVGTFGPARAGEGSSRAVREDGQEGGSGGEIGEGFWGCLGRGERGVRRSDGAQSRRRARGAGGGLNMAEVRVVRNDLLDSDVEVIAGPIGIGESGVESGRGGEGGWLRRVWARVWRGGLWAS